MQNELITDLTMTLLKSKPSKVLLDSTNDELILQNSVGARSTESIPMDVKLYHLSLWHRTPTDTTSQKEVLLPGSLDIVKHYYGFASLEEFPDKFDPNLQMWHPNVVDVSKDIAAFRQAGWSNINNNNFVDRFVACRALYSWMTDQEINSTDHIILERVTETGLPPGDYKFKVTTQILVEGLHTVPLELKQAKLGPYAYHDWYTEEERESSENHRTITPRKVIELIDVYDPRYVTVRISKSSRHSKGRSVDTSNGNQSGSRSSIEQDTPDLQLGE